MRAVDTNVLVRLITRDDAKQVFAAENFIGKGAWVSHLVLAETMWVLESVYDRNRAQIAIAVEMLLKHRDLTVEDAEVANAALGHFKKRPAVSYSDCLIVEIARKAGHLPLGTFEKDLAKIHGAQRLS